ncbi:MAG TPA: aldehyde ferredoxin oxidoreductase family protein [Chloroflexota bacterium]|nr:aldehyde ferredoxin oxidoreductase family protein [Chloroflexota bacterium]
MSGGYMGKILNVDLSAGALRDEALDEQVARDFLGGYGLGVKLLYDRMRPGVDPLGPENILGLLTGPLTGTDAIEGNRFVAVCKSPLTGTWGDANCGGTFGPNLKFAGYDGILFTGQSDHPVYLLVEEGQAELRDAGDLWGKDTNDTEDILRERHGKGAQVASIGQSGESLSLIACIINDYGRAAGRSGVGAVMGSKKLKAVVVKGTAKVPYADPAKVKAERKSYLKRHDDSGYELFTKYGTPGILGESAISGDSPVKNWAGSGMADLPTAATKFQDDHLIQTYQAKKYGCWRCTMACGGHMVVNEEGPYQGTKHHKSEYETACAFGTMMLNDSYASTIKANELCNRYGLDTISAGCTIAMAMECYEAGILTREDTDGIELTWGNDQAIIAVLERMGKREGFGDVLADGAKRAAERIGKGAEQYAIHVQGQEVPMHDPRFEPGLATTYQMDATPARHTQGGAYWFPPGYDVPKEFEKYQYSGKGDVHKWMSCMMHVVNAAGVCQFAFSSYEYTFIPDFLTAVTGVDYSTANCLVVGERIANLRHAFNLREGLNPLKFRMPGRLIGEPPLTVGNVRDVTVDVATQLRDMCEAMDWDVNTAQPSPRKLESLGLGYVTRDMAAMV